MSKNYFEELAIDESSMICQFNNGVYLTSPNTDGYAEEDDIMLYDEVALTFERYSLFDKG